MIQKQLLYQLAYQLRYQNYINKFCFGLSTQAMACLPGLVNNVISIKDGYNDKCVHSAARILQQGHIIAVPTDTIYGIAAMAQDSQAVKAMYSIKHRSLIKPMAISVAEVSDVYKWAKVTISHELLTALLPGPVTVVFQRSEQLNLDVNPGTELIGIRIPNHGFIRDVSRVCQLPLALTSANISAEMSPLCINEFQPLWSKLHIVFDGGLLGQTEECRLGSTIVDLSQPNSYRVIRRGSGFETTCSLLHKFSLKMID